MRATKHQIVSAYLFDFFFSDVFFLSHVSAFPILKSDFFQVLKFIYALYRFSFFSTFIFQCFSNSNMLNPDFFSDLRVWKSFFFRFSDFKFCFLHIICFYNLFFSKLLDFSCFSFFCFHFRMFDFVGKRVFSIIWTFHFFDLFKRCFFHVFLLSNVFLIFWVFAILVGSVVFSICSCFIFFMCCFLLYFS